MWKSTIFRSSILALVVACLAGVGCADEDGMGAGKGNGDTGGAGAGPGPDPKTPQGPLVDPSCVDGSFAEVLPDPMADISDLEAGFSPAVAQSFVLDVLERRYSTGHELTVRGISDDFNCVDAFLGPVDAPIDVYDGLPTVVHECGHGADWDIGGFEKDAYIINDSDPLIMTCTQGDSVDRGGKTFARSRIRDDAYQALNPNDSYAGIYLDGDPDDDNFDSGDQGFNSLLEENLQYVNSLATAYAFNNELNDGWTRSHRDGILTFLWYVPRYLRMARLDYPDAYAHIRDGEDGCWRELVLTIWGRAWLYLEVTKDMDHLGIDDDDLLKLVEDPELIGEIQLLREAEGCAP